MVTETQLRNISTRSQQLQARASSAEKALQEQQESQRTQQTQQTSQTSGLTPAQVEQFVMYPWGDEFARLPQSVQSKFEQAHQDYIGGARERKEELANLSIEKQMQNLSMTGAESGTLYLPTVVKVEPTTTTDIFGRKEIRDSSGNLQGYETETQSIRASIFKQAIDKKNLNKPTITSEINRYSNLGYSESESKALAKESVKQGGVSYSPEKAKEIINKVPYLEQIKNEGIIPPTIRKVSGATENVLNLVGKVGDIKTGVLSRVSGSPRTLGESASGIVQGIRKVGELSASGYEDMFFKAGISTEYTEKEKIVPIYQRGSIMGMGTNVLESPSIILLPEEKRKTLAGTFIEGVKIAPELILWGVAPEVMAGVNLLSSSNELKNINKNTNQTLEQQYNEYKNTIPEEGNRLLTKEEFFKENKQQVYGQLKNQALIGGGTSILFLGGSSIWRGVKVITKQKISPIEKANIMLQNEAKEKARNIKELSLWDKKITEGERLAGKKLGIDIKSKSQIYTTEGGKLKELTGLDVGTGTEKFYDIIRTTNLNIKENIPVKEFKLTDFPKSVRSSMEDALGFTPNKNIGVFKKGTIYTKEGLTEEQLKEVISHEQGHIFTNKFGSNVKITKEEALNYLKNKYGEIPDKYKIGNKAIKEYIADLNSGKVGTFNLKIEQKSGIKKEVVEDLSGVRKYQTQPLGGRLKLSPDVGVSEGTQVVIREAMAKGKDVSIIGVGGQEGARNNIINLEAFQSSIGRGKYIAFQGYKPKLGRKGSFKNDIIYQSTGRQIAKIKSINKETGIANVEFRSLPEPKLMSPQDIEEFSKTFFGKKSFEKGTLIKSEAQKYKEVQRGTGTQLDILLTPEQLAVKRSIILKKDITGFVENIPTKFKEDKGFFKFEYKKGGDGKGGTPLSKTSETPQVTQQVSKQESQQVLSKVNPIIKPKINTRIKSPKVVSSLIESNYPTYVGGTKLVEDWSRLGMGVTNPQEETIINLPAVQQQAVKSNVFTYAEFETIPTSDIKFKELSLEKTKQNVGELQLLSLNKLQTQQLQKQQLKLDLGLKSKEKVIEQVKEIQILKLNQLQKQTQQQRQQQLQKAIIRLRLQRPSKTTKIKVPKPIPPILPPILFGGKKTAKEQVKDLFEVFVKSKGKEVSIGETPELLKAGKGLRERLKSTLSASGYVTRKSTGKKVSFEELAPSLGEEFTAGKRDMFKVVQKRSKRLSTGSETFSIQKERKNKRMKWL